MWYYAIMTFTKNQAKLIKSLHEKKNRIEFGLFLVEGEKSISELLNSDFEIDLVLTTTEFFDKYGEKIRKKSKSYEIVNQFELKKVGTFETNNSALAVAKQKKNTQIEIKKDEIKDKISLVIMNPPFNIDEKTKKYIKENYGGRPLLPEIWFSKALDLFGHNVPIVMFTPYGFRLNQSDTSKRWQKFITKEYPEITSIVSLPKDVFENILFHSEVLIFNLPQLKGHYFLENNYVNQQTITGQLKTA